MGHGTPTAFDGPDADHHRLAFFFTPVTTKAPKMTVSRHPPKQNQTPKTTLDFDPQTQQPKGAEDDLSFHLHIKKKKK